MAGTLLLKYVNNMGASPGTTSVDLVSGNIQRAMGSWSTRSNAARGEFIAESMSLVSTTTAANIRTTQADLDFLFEQAKLSVENPIYNDFVYMYWQSDGESVKRSPVKAGESEIVSDQVVSPLIDNSAGGAKIRVGIERYPWWENESGTTVALGTNISTSGGTVEIGNDEGTLNQRISQLDLYAAAGTIYQMWAGIRPTYRGYANLVTTWECEAGTALNDASVVADAAASGGSAVKVDFAGTAWDLVRNLIYLSDVAASGYEDFSGKYLALLRAKPGGTADVFSVTLKYGFGNEDTPIGLIAGQVNIHGSVTTDYYLYELGNVYIPPIPDRGGKITDDSMFDTFFMRTLAARTSASGTLTMDCIYLIPSDHLVKCKRTAIGVNGGTTSFYTSEIGETYAIGHNSSNQMITMEYDFHNWEYPVGGGLFVIAGQDETDHQLSVNAGADITLFPRWRTFRTT